MQTKKILVVEDNELNQIYIATAVEEAGFMAEVTGNGQIAFQRLGEEHFDLVLTDVNVPGLNGIEFAKKVRLQYSSTLPIIAISGHSEQEFIDTCLAAGMNDFISKPFTTSQLLGVIKKAFVNTQNNAHVNAGQNKNNFDASGKKIYDYSAAIEIAKGDEDLLQKWILHFNESLQETISAVNSAIETNNYPERMREFHNMLNYANYYGLDDLSDHIHAFYSVRRSSQDKERFERFFKKIKEELQAISEYYGNIIISQ